MMSQSRGIPSFQAFIESVQGAQHAEFAARADSKVMHDGAFAEMKSHILGLYNGVDARHSFEDENGSIFDCIPIDRQPSLRNSRERIGTPPEIPSMMAEASASRDADNRRDTLVASPLGPDRHDRHGNSMYCPEGTIPMRRITLDVLTRFESVDHFLRKGPGAGGPPMTSAAIAPAVPITHRWAHAFQSVSNVGGHSFLNLWQPAIGANQTFSLSQHWYVAGSGNALQTAECGWQVYPQLYGGNKPVLFTYWTADNYKNTGCYNLSCTGFVQVSSAFTPGMTLGPVSVSGGAQYAIELSYYHTGGRWWLYVNGTAGQNAIGYYPDSVYQGGAMTHHAESIDYGGETTGSTSFPPMGSGAYANAGWQRAAYQRRIYYFPTAGGSAWSNLTASQGWPNCYTTQLNTYADPWNKALWFGGPGGNC